MSIDKFLRKAAKAKKKPHWCVEHQQWEAEPHEEKSLEKGWNPFKRIKSTHPEAQVIRDMAAGKVPDEKIPPNNQVMLKPSGPGDRVQFVPKQEETEGEKMDKTIKARQKRKSIDIDKDVSRFTPEEKTRLKRDDARVRGPQYPQDPDIIEDESFRNVPVDRPKKTEIPVEESLLKLMKAHEDSRQGRFQTSPSADTPKSEISQGKLPMSEAEKRNLGNPDQPFKEGWKTGRTIPRSKQEEDTFARSQSRQFERDKFSKLTPGRQRMLQTMGLPPKRELVNRRADPIEEALLKLMKAKSLTGWMPEGTPSDPRERPLTGFTPEELAQIDRDDRKVRRSTYPQDPAIKGATTYDASGKLTSGPRRRREAQSQSIEQSLMKASEQRFNAMAKDKVKKVKEDEEPLILVADGDSNVSPTKDSLENTLVKLIKYGSFKKVMERSDGEDDDPYGHKEAHRNPASIAQRWEARQAQARMEELGETGGSYHSVGRGAPSGFEDEAHKQRQEQLSGEKIPKVPMPTGNRLNSIENSILKLIKYGSDIKPSEVRMTRKNATIDKAAGTAPSAVRSAEEQEAAGGTGESWYGPGIGTATAAGKHAIDAGLGLLTEGKQKPGPSLEDIGRAAGEGAASALQPQGQPPQQQEQQQQQKKPIPNVFPPPPK